MPLCRVPKKGTRQRRILPSAKKWHSAKYIFAECQKKGTRQRRILPSAEKWHSAKYIFAECRKKHSAKPSLSSVFFYRVYFIWHSAKLLTLGKVPVSSSECDHVQRDYSGLSQNGDTHKVRFANANDVLCPYPMAI